MSGAGLTGAGHVDSSGDGSGDSAAPAEPHRRRRSRTRKILLITGLVVVLLVGAGVVGGLLYLHSVDSSIARVNAFSDVPQQSRPEKVAADAQNFLILGSDSRDPNNTTGSRSDTIIVCHIPKGHGSAQLVSIPRDTWTHIPPAKDGKNGNTDAKINAAYAWGGIPLVVQTVESYTNVRIDHVLIVDFAGFKEIIDALGGVDINVEKTFTTHYSLNANGIRTFNQGMNHMDGAAALDYSRERHAFADGDFARIRHQQEMIKAVLDKAASGGMLTDPGQLNAFIRATANAVTVDSTLSIFSTATDLRGLRGGNLKFFTSPSKGTGMVGTQSVVFPDLPKAKALFDAIRRDDVAAIVADGKS